jgi:hypothetical protein
MEMIFVRSGGFAGVATDVEGKVTFASRSARVTAGPSYKRELSENETLELRESMMQVSQNLAGVPSKRPDSFQFDIRIVGDDGSSRSVTVHDGAKLGSNYLADWVRQECNRICAARA